MDEPGPREPDDTNERQYLLAALDAWPYPVAYGKRRGQAPFGPAQLRIPKRYAAALVEHGLAERTGGDLLTLTRAGFVIANTAHARRVNERMRSLAARRLLEITTSRTKCNQMVSKVGTPKVTYESEAMANIGKTLSKIAIPTEAFIVIECEDHWHLRTRVLQKFEKARFRRELAKSQKRKFSARLARYGCVFPFAVPPPGKLDRRKYTYLT